MGTSEMERIATRVESYLTALAKTAGREFGSDGAPILTDEENELLRRAAHEDFVDEFKCVISVRIAMERLKAIFRGEILPNNSRL